MITKKSYKKKIFEHLDKHGYIMDKDVAKIWGKEPNWSTAEEYKRAWRKLQSDRNFFGDMKYYKLSNYRGKYMFMLDENRGYRIGKDYYFELVDKSSE
jgi:hypothetical protein